MEILEMSHSYKETDEYVFFYGSCFSQWAEFKIDIDGIEYNCCEQYMMSEKAKLFKDEVALAAIMKEVDPAKQKAWGKRVKNFNKEEWEKVCKEIVFKANYAKFTQAPFCYRKLMETGNKIIVEASPYDTIWGIGIGCNDARALDPKKWRGTNWLGEAIMKVRETIRQEKENKRSAEEA